MELLAAVEHAPPVAAADVVGELLAEKLDASAVAFLIADFGGGEKVIAKFADYFIFFYFGYLFSRQIFRAADWAYDHRRGRER